MALTAGLLDSYWRKYNQRRALTGLPSSYQEQRGMLDPIMESTANKDIQEAQLRSQNERYDRQLSMQEQAQKDAARAANISGATGLAQLGMSGYLGYKYMTKAPSAIEQLAQKQLLGSTAPTAVAPSVVAPGVGSGGILAGAPAAGVGSGAAAPAAGGFEVAGIGDYAAASGAGEGLGLAAASSAAPLLASAGAGAIGGYAGHALGGKVSDILGTHEKTTRDVMGVAGGAAAGFAVFGPVGAVVGGVVGLVEDMSVICSELLRQGRITERQRQACVVFRARHISNDMFAAYLEWAAPIVALMRRGGVTNMLLLPFTMRFVKYMITVQLGKKPTFTERLVWKYAWWRCERIAHKHGAMVMEVAA